MKSIPEQITYHSDYWGKQRLPTVTRFVEMFDIVFAGFMKSIVKEGWVPALLPSGKTSWPQFS